AGFPKLRCEVAHPLARADAGIVVNLIGRSCEHREFFDDRELRCLVQVVELQEVFEMTHSLFSCRPPMGCSAVKAERLGMLGGGNDDPAVTAKERSRTGFAVCDDWCSAGRAEFRYSTLIRVVEVVSEYVTSSANG